MLFIGIGIILSFFVGIVAFKDERNPGAHVWDTIVFFLFGMAILYGVILILPSDIANGTNEAGFLAKLFVPEFAVFFIARTLMYTDKSKSIPARLGESVKALAVPVLMGFGFFGTSIMIWKIILTAGKETGEHDLSDAQPAAAQPADPWKGLPMKINVAGIVYIAGEADDNGRTYYALGGGDDMKLRPFDVTRTGSDSWKVFGMSAKGEP